MNTRKTVVAIHQPNFLPWIGFFHKMVHADIFIYLDDVAFSKNSFQNRNKIMTAQGVKWLTVPVLHKGRYRQLTHQVQINESIPWRKKHLATLRQNYSKTRYFHEIWPGLEKIYLSSMDRLVPLNISLISFVKNILDIQTPTRLSSELGVQTTDPTKRLVYLTKMVGGETYLSGIGGKNYLDHNVFIEHGVKLAFQAFDIHSEDILSREKNLTLSVIDSLFRLGPRLGGLLRRL